MSLQVRMYVDGKDIPVLACEFGFKQDSDHTGRPSAKPRFSGLHVLINADKSSDMLEWATHPNMAKQVMLHFIPTRGDSKTRKVEFIDAHCIKNQNHFTSTGANPMTESLLITSAAVKDHSTGTEFNEYWRTTFPLQAPITSQENDKKVTRYFITDAEGNEIEEYTSGQKIILNIESNNRIGDSVTIRLRDSEHDFTHNGTKITNDTISNYVIGSDLEQIELEVIDQIEKETA